MVSSNPFSLRDLKKERVDKDDARYDEENNEDAVQDIMQITRKISTTTDTRRRGSISPSTQQEHGGKIVNDNLVKSELRDKGEDRREGRKKPYRKAS